MLASVKQLLYCKFYTATPPVRYQTQQVLASPLELSKVPSPWSILKLLKWGSTGFWRSYSWHMVHSIRTEEEEKVWKEDSHTPSGRWPGTRTFTGFVCTGSNRECWDSVPTCSSNRDRSKRGVEKWGHNLCQKPNSELKLTRTTQENSTAKEKKGAISCAVATEPGAFSCNACVKQGLGLLLAQPCA